MKYFRYLLLLVAALWCGTFLTSCNNEDDKPVFPEEKEKAFDMSGFAKGADVSWLTEMENSGKFFYDSLGKQRDCLELLRELGMNSIRLRVWVNPGEDVLGWCDKNDVLIKAWRAQKLGFRIMVDFHYSDSWADPGKQKIPAAWTDHSVEALKKNVADHTTEVLTLLKNNDIDVEWVQVGNETHAGMLFDTGNVNKADGMANFAQMIQSGYDAVKTVYPEAKVIVHLDQGQNASLYNRIFDGLKENGAKWDVIGMSLYPNVMTDDGKDDDWKAVNDACIANMKALIEKYNTPVMVCEIGINWNYTEAEQFFMDFMGKARSVNQCLGVFTWEPECYGGWKGYHKGMFTDKGTPTTAFNAFK